MALTHVLDTWTETEERRRVWWAALILDRYVHVGMRFRPLFFSPIPPDEILPADDEDVRPPPTNAALSTN